MEFNISAGIFHPFATMVSDREEGVVALYQPIGPLKRCSGLEPVLRCEPSTYQPLPNDIATASSGPVMNVFCYNAVSLV